MTETSATEIERCNKLLADLKIQERKLMEKDYRDEISAELFSEESTRIKRERLDATAIVARLNVHHESIQDALALVRAILSQDIHDLYLRATPTQRRFINQAIFESIWVSHGDLERSELLPPFDEIRIISEATRIVEQAAQRLSNGLAEGQEREKLPNFKKGSGALAQGSIRTSMVELRNVEPGVIIDCGEIPSSLQPHKPPRCMLAVVRQTSLDGRSWDRLGQQHLRRSVDLAHPHRTFSGGQHLPIDSATPPLGVCTQKLTGEAVPTGRDLVQLLRQPSQPILNLGAR